MSRSRKPGAGACSFVLSASLLTLCLLVVSLVPGRALAFGACQAFSQQPRARVIPARHDGALAEDTLAITYITHATFLIQTPKGADVATDYAGYAGGVFPRAVTMNNAHETHFTYFPDKAIRHVLKGWPEKGEERARHRLALEDLRIRNVSTDVIEFTGATRKNGNSIFIFELGDLCVAHLGHLHHIPTEAQFAEIGYLDVVMAPVDGGLTMSHQDMARLLKRLQAKLVLPMHYFTTQTLQSFLAALGEGFEVDLHDGATVLVSKATLPRKPTILVLQPQSADEFE